MRNRQKLTYLCILYFVQNVSMVNHNTHSFHKMVRHTCCEIFNLRLTILCTLGVEMFNKKYEQLQNVNDFSFRDPANIQLLKINNRNTRTSCEICSKLAIMTSLSSVPIADFEQVNTCSANIYLFKVNNSNTGKRYEICSKLIINIKT